MSYTAATTGSYTFTWVYSKDGSVNRDEDCGYLDNVNVPGYTGGSEYELGDVNMNGSVDMNDVTLVMRHAMGLISLSSEQCQLADYNRDGNVNTADAAAIMRRAMGI